MENQLEGNPVKETAGASDDFFKSSNVYLKYLKRNPPMFLVFHKSGQSSTEFYL